MKILAIEKELEETDWSNQKELLDQEAHHVFLLYLSGYLREIYFNEHHHAVLLLECETRNKAAELLNTLPLVRHNMVSFEIMQLNPYSGYERIMKRQENPRF